MLKPDSPHIYITIAKPDSATTPFLTIHRAGAAIFRISLDRGQLLKLLREVSAALA